MKTLTQLFEDKDHFMITGHRGASFEFPENTELSMQCAVEAGADMIEFDLRGTADGIPVLLHDETINRTSNGTGSPEDHPLKELKSLNFSYWLQGARRQAPAYGDVTIPTFEEILQNFRDKAAMNIQVYAKSDAVLAEICRLYKEYDMYDRGYFTIYPENVDKVRAIDPKIELCVTRGWQTRSLPENLELCAKEDHCRFVQPVREFTNAEQYALIRRLGMRSNVFFTDDPLQMLGLKYLGADGIMTNQAHLMCANRPR